MNHGFGRGRRRCFGDDRNLLHCGRFGLGNHGSCRNGSFDGDFSRRNFFDREFLSGDLEGRNIVSSELFDDGFCRGRSFLFGGGLSRGIDLGA
jgi:hypothetical protein